MDFGHDPEFLRAVQLRLAQLLGEDGSIEGVSLTPSQEDLAKELIFPQDMDERKNWQNRARVTDIEPTVRAEELPGILAKTLANYGQNAGQLAQDISGVTAVREGIGDIQKGLEDGSIARTAAGAGKAVVGAAPGAALLKAGRAAMRPLFATAPRAGATLGGSQVPWATTDTMDIIEREGAPDIGSLGRSLGQVGDNFSAVLSDMSIMGDASAQDAPMRIGTTDPEKIGAILKGMSLDQRKAYQSAIGVNPDGKIGTGTITKAQVYEQGLADKESAAAAAKASREQAATSAANEKELELARIKAEAEARVKGDLARQEGEQTLARQQREEEAKTPLRKLHPWLMPWIAPVALGAAGAVGGRVAYNTARNYKDKIDDLVARWGTETYRPDPNLGAMKAYRDEFGALEKARDSWSRPGNWLQAGKEAGEGAIVGGHIAAMPEIVDVLRGIPDAQKHFLSDDTMSRVGLEALGGGAAAAGVGQVVKGGLRRRTTPRNYTPETKAMEADPSYRPKPDTDPTGPSSGPQSPGPQSPTGGQGSTQGPGSPQTGPQGPNTPPGQGPGSGLQLMSGGGIKASTSQSPSIHKMRRDNAKARRQKKKLRWKGIPAIAGGTIAGSEVVSNTKDAEARQLSPAKQIEKRIKSLMKEGKSEAEATASAWVEIKGTTEGARDFYARRLRRRERGLQLQNEYKDMIGRDPTTGRFTRD